MNEKLQEMWDNAHEIPEGAFIPENTVLVQLDLNDHELSYYETTVSDYWKNYPKNSPVRSVEPLPDPIDTGGADFYVYDDNPLVNSVDIGDVEVTRTQARNFARKLLEALDGH